MKIVMEEIFLVWHSIVIVMLPFEIQDFPQKNPFTPHRIRVVSKGHQMNGDSRRESI
jgi:hypothetical protein